MVADPAAAEALRSARLLVSGSAGLPVPVFDQLVRLTGHAPVERYGATESLITLSTRADGERRPGWVGLPLAGIETRLVDDDGDPVPHDAETIGRLQVRGPTLFNGYLNRPDATAEAFDTDGWYRTGDAAVIDSDGMHRIVGRESVDLIKSGGYRVGAGEIETALLGHPGVAEAAVVGLPDDDLGQRIVAFVVGDAEPQELIDYVAQQLSVHKRPREVRVVDSLPRNAMGKVLKKELLTQVDRAAGVTADAVSPTVVAVQPAADGVTVHSAAATPMRRVAAACLVGSAIEFYDFLIYGTAAALVFPTVFFPHLSPTLGTIASMGTFASAFVSRPIGAADLRLLRRSAGPEEDPDRHAVAHGRRHGVRGRGSQHGGHRPRGPVDPGRAAAAARICRRRRMGRLGAC